MAKKGKRNRDVKKKRRRAPRDPIQRIAGLYAAPHPLNRVDRGALKKALIGQGRQAAAEFAPLIEEVEQRLGRLHPQDVLSTLARYGLVSSVREDGKQVRKFQGEGFSQTHVELAQALSLRREWGDDRVPPDSGDIQFFFDQLPVLSDLFFKKRYVALEEDADARDAAVRMLQEHLRLHTQVVRNWGYFQLVTRTVHALVQPLDELAREEIGVPLTAYVDLMAARCEALERDVQSRYSRLREVVGVKGQEGQLAKLFELLPEPVWAHEPFRQAVADGQLSEMAFRAAVLRYADLTLVDEYTTGLPAAVAYFGSDHLAVAALARVSIRPGGLADTPSEHIFLTNPVWTRPLIELEDGRYFASVPHAFFSFALTILNDIGQSTERLKGALEQRKAKFLEDEIARVLSQAFPGAAVERNFRWVANGEEYENDVLVLVDSHLLIVEAKSGSISWPALRGAPDRARRHFEDLVTEPSVQSERLREAVERVMDDPALKDELLPRFPFDISKIKKVLRLSVTLEDFAVVQSNTRMAVEAGWVPEGHVLPPTLLLSDLEAAMEILATRAERIHYLSRRAELERQVSYQGDEMDLLGTYLANGFDLGIAEGIHMALTGMSGPIDEYYQAQQLGLVTDKPQRKLTKWWRDIIQQFETRGFERWSEASTILLDMNLESQKTFERKFEAIRANVHKNWRHRNHLSSVVFVPGPPRMEAIVLYAFKNENADGRKEAMEELVTKAFEKPHIQRCLVVGLNIDQAKFPYSTVAVFERPHEPQSD